MKKIPKKNIIIFAAAVFVGLMASLLWYLPTDALKDAEDRVQVRVTEPEDGVRTPSFPVKLLQAAAKAQPDGNVVVAPNSLCALLTRLKGFSDGAAKKALEALDIPDQPAYTAVLPIELALVFPDSGLCSKDKVPAGRDIHPLPFHSDIIAAYTQIGDLITSFSNSDFSSTTIEDLLNAKRNQTAGKAGAASIDLVATCGVSFHKAWMQPPNPSDSFDDLFFSGDGTGNTVRMLRFKGGFRVAEAKDGSWKAAALFFCNDRKQEDSACLVVVRTNDTSAHHFVLKELSADKLNEIRTALVHAQPRECVIEMPVLTFSESARDMEPVLKGLGLGCLYTEAEPFPGLTGGNRAPLTLLTQQHALFLTPDPDPSCSVEPAAISPGAPAALRLDHPFFWYVGDLASDSPPYLMGIVESL